MASSGPEGAWRPAYGPAEAYNAPVSSNTLIIAAPTGQLPTTHHLSEPKPSAPLSARDSDKLRKKTVWFWLTIIIFGFGISIFVNAVATDLIPPTPAALAIRCKAAGGEEVSILSWVAVAIVNPVYALAMGRAISLLLIYLYLTKRDAMAEAKALLVGQPMGGAAAARTLVVAASSTPSKGDRSNDSCLTSIGLFFCTRAHWEDVSQKFFPIAIGLFNCIAYSAFIGLTALAEVSIWSSMVGLFAVFPVSYGILFKGESKTPKKLAGVVLCISAAIILAMAGGEPKGASAAAEAPADGDSSAPSAAQQPLVAIDAPMTVKLFLYFVSVAFLGLSDGMSAYILNDGNAKAAAAATASASAATLPDAGSGSGSGSIIAVKDEGSSSVGVGLATAAATGATGWDSGSLVAPPCVVPAATSPVAPPAASVGGGKRPPLSMISITLYVSLGFLIFAGMIGGLSILLNALIHLPLSAAPNTPQQAVVQCFQAQMQVAEAKVNSPGYGGGLFLIFVGQLLGKIAWFAVVQLGRLSEVSSFIPLVGLDVMITSLLGIVVLGERPAPIGYLGFALAGVGIWAIADTA